MCPDSEVYVRYIRGDARIRVLDMEVRKSDRTLFLFGDYLDTTNDYGKYNDIASAAEERMADCWMARANIHGHIQETVFWRTRDELHDDLGTPFNRFEREGINGNFCKSFWVQKVGDQNELVGVATKFRQRGD